MFPTELTPKSRLRQPQKIHNLLQITRAFANCVEKLYAVATEKIQIREVWGASMNAINKGYTKQILSSGLIVGVLTMLFVALPASAQDSNIRTQCPTSTTLHPDTDSNDATREAGIKCDHLAAGDGMVTMADGNPQYIFSFRGCRCRGRWRAHRGEWQLSRLGDGAGHAGRQRAGADDRGGRGRRALPHR